LSEAANPFGIITRGPLIVRDVDVLAARVKRGAELLRVCRARITAAKVEVTQIVAELDPGTDVES